MAKESISQMSMRQKGIIATVVIVILIIVWQVMSLFPKSSPPPVPVAKNTPAMTGNPGPANAPSGGPNAMSANNNGPNAPQQPPPEQLQKVLVPADNQFNQMQKMTEEKYISKLNELEELKIQKQIAETNQAISAAKLATVTAEKDISDLLTKPAPPPPLPASAYANQLVSPTNGPPGMILPPIPPPAKEEAPTAYSVISVSMQLHKWSAVIGFQGRLFHVSVGDVLPIDGSVVSSINRSGVTLKRDNQIRKISMISSI